MSLLLAGLLAQAASSATSPSNMNVAHPQVPCWTGERSWTLPAEPPSSTTLFTSENDETPVRIVHGRDLILDGDAVEEDYNFLDYHFANEGRAVMARI